ncbi:hypothetical protein OAP83_01640 [Rickettsiales bacterium]|nr:hypothetical protein [Rickettsiales bacterium]
MTRSKEAEMLSGAFDEVAFANTHIRSIADLFARSIITAEEFNVAVEAILHTKGRSLSPEFAQSGQEVASYPVYKSFQEGSRIASVIHLPKLDINPRPIKVVKDKLEESLRSVDAEKTFQSFSDMLSRLIQEFLSKESCASMGKILAVYNPSPNVWASACLDLKLNDAGKIDAKLQIFAKQDLAFSKILTNIIKKLVDENKSIVLTKAPQRLIEARAEDFMVQLVLAQAVFDGLNLALEFDQIESLVEIKSREQIFDKIYEAYQYNPGQANATRYIALEDFSERVAEQKDNPFLILYPFLVSAEEAFEIYSKLHNILCFFNDEILAEECLSAMEVIRSTQSTSYQALNLLSRWALEKTILVQNPEFRLQQIDFTDNVYVSWLEQALRYCKRDEAADVLISNYQTIDSSWFINLASWSLNKQYQALVDLNIIMETKEVDTSNFQEKYYGFTPLQVAAILNQSGLLLDLIDMGVDQSSINILPAHLAAHNGHFESLKACLSKNPGLVTSHGQNGNNLLHSVIWGLLHQSRFNHSLIDYLVSEFPVALKNMVFEQNASGKAPFLMASSSSAKPVLIRIILNRARLGIDLRNDQVYSCFPGALRNDLEGQRELRVIERARDLHGQNKTNHTTSSGATNIFQAIEKNDFALISLWLRGNYFDPLCGNYFDSDLRTESGDSLLYYIIACGGEVSKMQQLQLFLDHGVGFNGQESQTFFRLKTTTKSALQLAFESKLYEEAKVLIFAGVYFPIEDLDLIPAEEIRSQFEQLRLEHQDQFFALSEEILTQNNTDFITSKNLDLYPDTKTILFDKGGPRFDDICSAIKLLLPEQKTPESLIAQTIEYEQAGSRAFYCAEHGFLKELIFWLNAESGGKRTDVKHKEKGYLLEHVIRNSACNSNAAKVVTLLLAYGFNTSLSVIEVSRKNKSKKATEYTVAPTNLLELSASLGNRQIYNRLLFYGLKEDHSTLSFVREVHKSDFADLIEKDAAQSAQAEKDLLEAFAQDEKKGKSSAKGQGGKASAKKKAKQRSKNKASDKSAGQTITLPDDKKSSDIDREGAPELRIEAESDEEGVWQIVGPNKGRSATKHAQQDGLKKAVEPIVQSVQVVAAAEEATQTAAELTKMPDLRNHDHDSDKSSKLMENLKLLEDVLLSKLGCSLAEEVSDILSFKLEKSQSITFNRIYGRFFGVFFNASSNILQGNRTSFTTGVKDLFESKLSEGLGSEEIASKFLADISDLAKVLDRANNAKTIFRDSNIEINKESIEKFIEAFNKAYAIYSNDGNVALEWFIAGADATGNLAKESHSAQAHLAGLNEFIAIKDMASENLDRYTELYNFGVSLALSSYVEIQQVGAMGGRA